MLRINGELHRVDYPPLDNDGLRAMLYEIAPDYKIKHFEESGDVDFGYEIPNVSRFRVNFFNQKFGCGAVFRQIPSKVLSFEDFEKFDAPLPSVLKKFAMLSRGLVVVTGPTGSGKSTTLASMIDKVNAERHEHIVTIEDPIEYLHTHKRCLVNQRELGSDTKSFPAALRSVLRQDPDVVLIGEMRDLETIECALRVAETGHLTFATLHTNSAAQTINRIVDVFPPNQQSQVRAQLSLTLEGILCQSLLPRAAGHGRVMAMEILVPNSAIRNLIREDKIHQIYSMMQTGQAKHGMQTFNQSLATLYFRRLITLQTALSVSHNAEELQEMINRGVGTLGGGAASVGEDRRSR